jgi:hypothetical protein
MSTKAEGLHNCLDKFANYSSKWGLSMNYKKTKIMIFNKGGKLIKCSFSVNDYKLESSKMLTESFMKMLNKVGLRLSPCFTPISDLKQLLKLLSIFTQRTLHEYIDLIILKNFNSILNNRLVIFLRENKILNNEQIGFRKGSRTADHIFKLKTLICKYIQKSGKI